MDRSETARASASAAEIERRSLDEDIADRLRQEILNGSLKPGLRLTELDLAARWQVSQATVRAALKTLTHEGLVESRPRRGSFVITPTQADVVEIYSLRDALESLAARTAAARIDEAGRKALERVLRAMRSTAASGNRKRMLDLDFDFHRTIVEISGNRRLREVWSNLEGQTRLFLRITDQFHHDLDELVALHAPIAEAILAGDAETAHALARDHSARDGTRLAATFATD